MNLAHKCYTERVDMIDIVLKNTKDLFINTDISVVEHRTPFGRELEKLLKISTMSLTTPPSSPHLRGGDNLIVGPLICDQSDGPIADQSRQAGGSIEDYEKFLQMATSSANDPLKRKGKVRKEKKTYLLE